MVLCLAMASTFSVDARIISGRGYSGKYSNGKKGNEQERQEEICKAKDCLSVWYLKFLSMTERLIFLFKAVVTNHSREALDLPTLRNFLSRKRKSFSFHVNFVSFHRL